MVTLFHGGERMSRYYFPCEIEVIEECNKEEMAGPTSQNKSYDEPLPNLNCAHENSSNVRLSGSMGGMLFKCLFNSQ